MRFHPVLLIFILPACGELAPNGGNVVASAAPEPDTRIECRFGEMAQFERSCTLEGREGEGGRILAIRKPDGGFRRLEVVDDGRGVVAADGAEAALVTLLDDRRIEVAIGGDRFRLPATAQR